MAAAADRQVVAQLRLVTAAASLFLETQLGVSSAGLLVRRTWQTPGGRLAAHVALPTPQAAQALARKRWRLRGTRFSVDLLRDQVELAARRVGQQQCQHEAMAFAPSEHGGDGSYLQTAAAVASAAIALPFCLQWSPFIPVALCTMLTLLLVFLAWRIAFPP